ncbi:hypothetical protein QBC33DRAFT_283555 [Phialemonium atrogriseum]|uniref:Viral a-type inclusion protein n=1 Tax=Phialemonium atrogriseum TaxID=1093897 RepID=A0AAJ0BQ22_9PEZI|nr:uncharacterized protein QBC33DRAFT_283555 [Phialemonium atrogriseum]KAK1762368.1 hypothetical protein QBC33DRAFT_283555 [Phialemonium atrogriseum]
MDSDQRSERMRILDTRYQNITHQHSIVVKDEEARRLKLRSVLLQNENGTLKDQLAQKDDQVTQLITKCDAFHGQLEAAAQKCRQHETQMRIQARELSNLKEEMSSLDSVTKDSAKTLTEKLALSREVALLKPEIEHLRSQLSHQKDVLAEKLALERQINALEVELANEKRAVQKAASKQSREDDGGEELRKHVRDLEKQLAKEKRTAQKALQNQGSKDTAAEEEIQELREKLAEAERMLATEKQAASKATKTKNATTTDSTEELDQLREKIAETKAALAREKKEKDQIRKEYESALAEAEGRRLPLEERLDNVKAKLRETREELKQCRADLQRAQEQAAKKPAGKAPAGKKRRANDITAEETLLLHTPNKGEDRPKRTAKRGFGPAAVGEKSTFSITPFLNKTINLSDISPKPQGENSTDATTTVSMSANGEPTATEPSEEPAVKAAAKTTASGGKPRGRPTTKALAESSPSRKNMPAPKRRKAPVAESTLEKVTEEAEEDGQGQENRPAEEAADGKKAVSALKRQPQLVPPNTTDPTGAPTAAAAAVASVTEQSEPKKKKRKLLGASSKATLFGGEADAEDAEHPVVATAATATATATTAATKRAPAARVALGAGGVAKRAVVGLGAAKNAFAGAAFSPLKRDRRGVNASFLA